MHIRKYTIDNSFNEAMIDDAMTTNRSTSDQEKPYVVGYAFPCSRKQTKARAAC